MSKGTFTNFSGQLLEEEDNWISPLTGSTYSTKDFSSGNAWTSEIEEAGSQVWSNPPSVSLLESTAKEGETPQSQYSQTTDFSIPYHQALTEEGQSFTESIQMSQSLVDTSTGGGGGEDTYVPPTDQHGNPKLDWGNLGKSWAAMDFAGKAGVVAGIAGHLSTLVGILDGRDKTKIIGMGKSYSSAARGGYNPVARPWYS